MIVMREIWGNLGRRNVSTCFDEWKSVNVPSVPNFPNFPRPAVRGSQSVAFDAILGFNIDTKDRY